MLRKSRNVVLLLFSLFSCLIFASPPEIPQPNVFTSGKIVEKQKNPTYEIVAMYPVMQGNAPYVQPFNRYVLNLMQKEVREFKDELVGDVPPNPSALDIKYKYYFFVPERFVSIQFYEYSYLSGAAHPNTETYVVNYDFVNNRDLSLREIFKSDVNYLNIISEYCINQLKTRKFGEVDFIKDGAAPVDRNYHDWNITKDGLLIVFDAYQVAPYVYGKQTVVIPYTHLKPYLKEEYINLFNIK